MESPQDDRWVWHFFPVYGVIVHNLEKIAKSIPTIWLQEQTGLPIYAQKHGNL